MTAVRSRKFYQKLIWSYTSLTLVLLLLVGSSSYAFFNWNYNQEVKRTNEQMLEQKASSLMTGVVEELTGISYNLLSNYQGRNEVTRLFDDELRPSDWKITEAYLCLSNIVRQNSRLIESISVYYPDAGLFLSTVSGSNYLDRDNAQCQEMIRQIERRMETGQSIAYESSFDIYRDSESRSESRITLYTSYPYSPYTAGEKGLMSIAVHNSYIAELLNGSDPNDGDLIFCITESGDLINADEAGTVQELLASDSFQKKLQSGDSFRFRYGTNHYIFSSSMLDRFGTAPLRTGWRFVQASPLDNFYGRSRSFLAFLVVICLTIVLLGMILAKVFSKNLYRPLKDTVTRIVQDTPPEALENEYEIINNYVAALHQKASSNQELVYQTVINSLITRQLDIQEIDRMLFSADIEFEHPVFLVGLLSFSQQNSEKDSYAQTLLLRNRLCRQSGPTGKIYAVLMENETIGVLYNTSDATAQAAEALFSVVQKNCSRAFRLLVSSPIRSAEYLHSAYAVLKQMDRYVYFFPEQTLFLESELYIKELSSREFPIPIKTLLPPLLKNHSLTEIQNLLERLRDEIEAKDYSFETCNSKIIETIYMLTEYIRQNHLEKDLPPETIYSRLSTMPDIQAFIPEFLEIVSAADQLLNMRSQNHNLDVVRRVQEYIYANLQNDISLDDAARTVSLSPPYVSRIFRDIAGINFVSYVKKCKMERASELLRQGEMNVDQVAVSLGYNSTAYFIKNFKDSYGVTPKAYQKRWGEK